MPTTFKNPFIKYKNTNIYCVPNIPSYEPTEASIKLSNSIYPYLNSLISSDDSYCSDNSDDCDNAHNSNKYLIELNKGLYVNT